MDYQPAVSPIEFYIKADDYAKIEPVRDSLLRIMKQDSKLFYVHSDYDETQAMVDVVLKNDIAARLGITQTSLSLFLSGALSGTNLTSLWDGDYSIPIAVYSEHKGHPGNPFAALHVSKNLPEVERLRLMVAKLEIENERL